MMLRTGSNQKPQLTDDALNEIIKVTGSRLKMLDTRLRIIYAKHTGMNEKKIEEMDPEEIMDRLYTAFREGKLHDSKIKDELQSYNILENEQYIRFSELKSVLDQKKNLVNAGNN